MPHSQPIIPVRAADGHSFELIHAPSPKAFARLLFLPGMGLSARQYIAFAQSLAAKGIDTLIHEWRGLGSSSLRAARDVDWGYRELLELDLAAAIDAARDASGDKTLLIGGHSLGSQLALLAAAQRRRDCRGLVVVAGGAPYWRCYQGWMRVALRGIFVGMPLVARVFGHYPGRRLGFAGREARSIIKDWAASGRTGQYRPRNLDFDFETHMQTLTCPLLSVRMMDDWFVPQASLNWLTDKLSQAAATQTNISHVDGPGSADHYQWMKHPESTAAAIATWWAQQVKYPD
jgi:predicted alpha/beta hydrolase